MLEKILKLFRKDKKNRETRGSRLRLLGFEGHVDGFYPWEIIKRKGYVVEPHVALDVPPAKYENDSNRIIRAREIRGHVIVVVQMRDRTVRSAFRLLDIFDDIL